MRVDPCYSIMVRKNRFVFKQGENGSMLFINVIEKMSVSKATQNLNKFNLSP